MSKNILITGTSSGFGKLTTLTLLERGHTVVASMRGAERKNKPVAEELRTAGALIVEIDVTSDDSVNHGVETAINMADGLNVIINNAGAGVIGLQECFSPKEWQKLFDVNVFGAQRVNRAVLPHMRQRNSGLLIHISSLLGRIVLPFLGPYNASKWALEALAENYRVELSGFGIDSCIIEPGAYPTTFMEKIHKPNDTKRETGYGSFAEAPKEMLKNFENALTDNIEQNPQNVANAIADLIDTPPGQRNFRTIVDNIGMGIPVKGYNEQLEQITAEVYNSFGLADMLTLKVK